MSCLERGTSMEKVRDWLKSLETLSTVAPVLNGGSRALRTTTLARVTFGSYYI